MSSQVEIEIAQTVVKIFGSRPENDEKQGVDFLTREIKRGKFERIFELPCKLIIDQATAAMNQGILHVTVPIHKEDLVDVVKLKIGN